MKIVPSACLYVTQPANFYAHVVLLLDELEAICEHTI